MSRHKLILNNIIGEDVKILSIGFNIKGILRNNKNGVYSVSVNDAEATFSSDSVSTISFHQVLDDDSATIIESYHVIIVKII